MQEYSSLTCTLRPVAMTAMLGTVRVVSAVACLFSYEVVRCGNNSLCHLDAFRFSLLRTTAAAGEGEEKEDCQRKR